MTQPQIGAPGAYDAVVVVSFGGPERHEDVMPFLENVVRGRRVPRERLIEVAHHYDQFGSVSPINAQNRAFVDALRADMAAHGLALPVYWGNRNWHPFLADTVRQMRDDGVRRALAYVTAAYGSYSSCRQYREDIARARAEVGPDAPEIEKLRLFYHHPGFIEASVDHARAALGEITAERRASTPIAFTAHSIPLAMARNSRYEAQLQQTCGLIARGLAHDRWELVYQSRSGDPRQPWLEPDILDHLRALAGRGERDVVVMPLGFLSDHVEVLYDLDTEARTLAAELGLNFARASTVGTHPAFVAAIRELIEERVRGAEPRALGPIERTCYDTCCLPG